MKKLFVAILIALGIGSYLFYNNYQKNENSNTEIETKIETNEEETKKEELTDENKKDDNKDMTDTTKEDKTKSETTNNEVPKEKVVKVVKQDYENKVNIVKKNLGFTPDEKTVQIMAELDEMANLTDYESKDFFDKVSKRLSKIVKLGYAKPENLKNIFDLTKVLLVKEKEYKVGNEKLSLDDLDRSVNSAFNILALNQDSIDKKEIISKTLGIKIDKNTVEIMAEIDQIANFTDYESKAFFNKAGTEIMNLVKESKLKSTDLKKVLNLTKLVLSKEKETKEKITVDDANKALMDVLNTLKK